MDNLTAQPDRNPMVNLAGMRRSDDLRNLALVSLQLSPAAAGEIALLIPAAPVGVAGSTEVQFGYYAVQNAPGFLTGSITFDQAASATGLMFQRVVIPNWVRIGIGIEETGNFFSSCLSNDGLFIPTPVGVFGAGLNAAGFEPDFGGGGD